MKMKKKERKSRSRKREAKYRIVLLSSDMSRQMKANKIMEVSMAKERKRVRERELKRGQRKQIA